MAAPAAAPAGGKYFANSKRGEVAELREELDSKDKDIKKEAVKKVIAAMTVGKDVSALFTQVLKVMVTNDVELKKLVYLYLMNYAKTQPDLAILAVNAFVKDANDPNPLIRALAIRTMSSIRVEEVTNYLCEPLRKAIKDDDPYVRKTAAVCIAKLNDIDEDLVEQQGFLDDLRDMLADSNPVVVSNAVAALSEIAATNPSVFELTEANLSKLLAAINECTEWGQIFILEAVSAYAPQSSNEAESIVDRVAPRLSHANSGVVLAACKVIMRCVDFIESDDFVQAIGRKISPALVTLLGSEPEVQYVALRNIIILLQRMPTLLQNDIRVFYCRYNDPIYVKMEKLEVMIMLANQKNIEQVLQEFKDSASEVDVDFVRKAVRSIGRCAIKLEPAADLCVKTLLELIESKVSYVVQEVIVVIKDIFRKYPNRYESVIGQLCENLDSLDEPDAKGSLFWIIGEYADRIDNAHEILEAFYDTFAEEPSDVQLQFLTAIVKCFIVDPENAQDLMRRVLGLATQSDNPDLRDRGYLYWRLLSADASVARDVVLAEKPVISGETTALDRNLLKIMLKNVGSLASVFFKPPEAFVSKLKMSVPKTVSAIPADDADMDDVVSRVAQRDDDGAGERTSSNAGVDELLDLGGLGISSAAPAARKPASSGGVDDLLGDLGMSAPTPAPAAAPAAASGAPKLVSWTTAAESKGMSIMGAVQRDGQELVAYMAIRNESSAPLSGFFIQLNVNPTGLAPQTTKLPIDAVAPGQVAQCKAVLVPGNDAKLKRDATGCDLDVAIKNNVGVFYMKAFLHPSILLRPDGKMERTAFLEQWGRVADADEVQRETRFARTKSSDAVQRELESQSLFAVARRSEAGEDVLFMSCRYFFGSAVLVEIRVGQGRCSVATRSENNGAASVVADSISRYLQL